MTELAAAGGAPPLVNPHQAQAVEAVLYSPYRGVAWAGAAGAGKSWGAALAMLLHAQRFEAPLVLLGGQAIDTLRGNLAPPLEHWARRLGLSYRYIGNPPAFRIGTAEFELRGLQDADSCRRIQGRNYCGAFVDELTACHPDSWDMLLTRLRTPGARWLVTFNKLGPRHWTKLRVYDNAEGLNCLLLESTDADNPHLPEDYRASVRRAGALAPHQYQRLVLNQWAAPEGQIYPYWDDEAWGEALAGQPCVAGVDYGESGVTAAVFLQRVPERPEGWAATGEYWHDGHQRERRSPEEHARAIKAAAPGPLTRCYVDPSAPALRDALRRQGLAVRAAYNKADGYELTGGWLQESGLTLDAARLPALVTELEDLVYNAHGKPDPKCSDHATDALRYVVCGVHPRRARRFSFEVSG